MALPKNRHFYRHNWDSITSRPLLGTLHLTSTTAAHPRIIAPAANQGMPLSDRLEWLFIVPRVANQCFRQWRCPKMK